MSAITLPAAIVSSLTGVFFLFACWKKIVPAGLHLLTVIAGWLVLFFSLLLWCKFAGAEIGVVTGLCFPAMMAWLVIAWNSESRKARTSVKKADEADASSYRKTVFTGNRQKLEHLIRFVLVIVLSLAAGLSFNLAIVALLDLYIETAMAFTVLMLPVSWGIAAWWSASDDHSWRPAAGLFCSSVICAAIAFL